MINKFDKVKYLYAIQELSPKAKFSINNGDLTTLQWLDETVPRPNDAEIEAKATELATQYENNQYQRNREWQYPPIKDQLDMLYHDIKNGNLENGSWIEAIEEVKAANPKK